MYEITADDKRNFMTSLQSQQSLDLVFDDSIVIDPNQGYASFNMR
jgi:hypothetical protein